MSTALVFGATPPPPKACLTCKRPRWAFYRGAWLCLACYQGNPMVVEHGDGPEGMHCLACEHMVRVGGHARDYLKCERRGITAGPGTDHRVGWPACALFESVQESEAR